PTHIVGVLREGLAALPVAAGEAVVRLHPDDAAAVRDCLAPGDGEASAPTGERRAWRIESDPLIERGGCIIDTDRSSVDARLETRLARAMAALLEDERGAVD